MKEPRPETAVGASGWVQDELYALKGRIGSLEQQLEELRNATSSIAESVRNMETSLRMVTLEAAPIARLQEELNQAAALLMQLQDQQADTKDRVDAKGRHEESEDDRAQRGWSEVEKRTELLERQVAQWQDRQAGVDEVGRRFQEGLSLVRQQLQRLEQQLEATESKAGSGVEGAKRVEVTLRAVQTALTQLEHTDAEIAERARMSSEVSHRVETLVNEKVRELERVEMLAERVELHRAERQRLEDRALRLEEELGELRQRADVFDHDRTRLNTQQETLSSRLDSLNERVDEQRALLADQIRRLIATEDRTKRRQIQELEREIRETKQYVAELTDK